jgi:hypothetical protein
MTKISEYPVISIPTADDLLIGTDIGAQNETKNFSVQSIIDITLEHGVIGFFSTSDVKTITVVNGLITSIV